MRERIENIIKNFSLDRELIFEVSHLKYADILKRIEKKFVKSAGSIHWANIENRFNPSLPLQTKYVGNNLLWYYELGLIIPDTLHYVLFEDSRNFAPKYWLYEMFPSEIIKVLDECEGLDDYYIISKKLDWLISECHESIVYFVGSGIDISLVKESR